MNVIDRIDSHIAAFMRMSPIARRLVTILVCIVLLGLVVVAAKTGHEEAVNILSFVALVGLCWATGFWYVLRGALVVLAWWLRLFR